MDNYTKSIKIKFLVLENQGPKIKSGQKIDLGNGKFFITDKPEKFQELKI